MQDGPRGQKYPRTWVDYSVLRLICTDIKKQTRLKKADGQLGIFQSFLLEAEKRICFLMFVQISLYKTKQKLCE
jgi:hypothetical protein